MKNNGLKNAKAITLIAMVVTIIVLLILAGVSIAVLTGENGIINRASSAKTTNEEAEIMENIRLAYNNAQIGKYAGKNENFANIMKSDLEKVYGTGDNNVKVDDNGDNTYTVTIRGRKYNVAANGNVTRKSGVTIGERTTKLKQGESAQVTASVDSGIPGTISWKSSDSTKVSVTGSGTSATITAVAASGSAEITAYIAGTEHEDKFTVNIAQAITGINASPLSIGTGETVAIEITTTPNTGVLEDITYSFVSNNTAVATVDSTTGEVTGVTQGNATITITPSNGLEAITCNAEVTKVVGKFQTVNGKAYYYTGSNPTAGTEITKDNIGNYLGMKVNYTPDGYLTNSNNLTVGTSTTYRLFYIDIATDAHPSGNYYGDGLGTIYLKADGDGINARLDYLPEVGTNDVLVTENYNKMWAANSTYRNNLKENMTYVNRLLDKNIWDMYKDDGTNSAGIANYVVGAPSLEIWVDSYNLFLAKNPVSGKYAHNCTVTQDTTNGPTGENKGYGYYIGYNNAYADNSGLFTTDDTLVNPSSYSSNAIAAERVTAWNRGSGQYWLASPSANGVRNVMLMLCVGGYLNGLQANYYPLAFCPLVCCNSGVAITEAQ